MRVRIEVNLPDFIFEDCDSRDGRVEATTDYMYADPLFALDGMIVLWVEGDEGDGAPA